MDTGTHQRSLMWTIASILGFGSSRDTLFIQVPVFVAIVLYTQVHPKCGAGYL